MRNCKKCDTEYNIDEEICSNCGNYVKFPKTAKWLLLGCCIFWPLLFVALFYICKDCKIWLQINNGTYVRPNGIKKLKSFYLGNATLRKKDGNVLRGDCEIIFENEIFKIKQGEEIVENMIDSIYQLDLWKYEGLTYFKILMRSHTDYKFRDSNGIAKKLIYIMKFNSIDIDDNRIKNEDNCE